MTYQIILVQFNKCKYETTYFLLFRPDVSLEVELGEEDKEESSMCGNVVGELPGESAIVVKCKLETVKHNCHELEIIADH